MCAAALLHKIAKKLRDNYNNYKRCSLIRVVILIISSICLTLHGLTSGK